MGGNTSNLKKNEVENFVTKVEVITRNIQSGSQMGCIKGFFSHHAVRLTMRDGKQYIIETGPDKEGKGNPVSFSDARHSNHEWQKISEAPVVGKTVDDFIKSAGPDKKYDLIRNNCQHAVQRMIKDNVIN